MTSPVTVTDLDARIWREELGAFVPAQVFDVHTHSFRWAHNLDPNKNTYGHGQIYGSPFEETTFAVLDACDAALFPSRQVRRLVFPFPFAQCDFAAANEFIADQVAQAPGSAALMLVHPSMSAEYVEATVRRHGFLGLKPYRFYSTTGDAVECRITDFMAEPHIAVADRYGLIIMLHLSKRLGIADPQNQRDLLDLTQRYPNVRWILAHCARSYSAWGIERAAQTLRDLPHVLFDTSSVCESDAFDALYSAVGMERVMYGSDDAPVGVWRGKYVTWGYAWAYLSPDNHQFNLSHCDGRMTFTRYEQLRGMRRAAARYGATHQQIADHFCGTAERLVEATRRSLARHMS